ncbi:GntP family permease [Phytoactinopolyspora halotolerans]|uniref:GntP family permease n=1 Tax=Phytoactinopolyspora halotolerans TaxID=1981512 RepID=A0A6L9S5I6_9ACTN|nr:GntP family permease [Phytoactinopolyspora halotolerans]NEE00715.1 GntP family permease [Phytoactinopolyspora halotolerans]
MDNDVEPALSTGPLLLIAAASVAVLLFLIMRVRLHAFLSLIVVSLLTALATRIPLPDVVPTMVDGIGGTLGDVALLVALGAILGRLLEISGGAQVLADVLVGRTQGNRAALAIGVAALLFGFPIFFDAGLVVFLPILFTVARRMGGSLLTYGLPVAGAFAVMHAFVPPHPGPVAAAGLIDAEVGLVLVFGLAIGVPTWFFGSYLFGLYVGRRVHVAVPQVLASQEEVDRETEERPPPRFLSVLGILLLPLLLIFGETGLGTLEEQGTVDGDNTLVQAVRMVGQTPVALLIAVLVAIVVCGFAQRRSAEDVEKITDGAFGPVASIILITGAGGMFGAVLQASGIGQALAETLEDTGMPVIVAAFVVAAALRVSQGSATVALITASSLMAPVIGAGDYSEAYKALTVIAIAGGSTVLSHVNDSGFWLVGRFFEMDVRTTLKTWTVMVTLLGGIAALLAFAASTFV